MKKTIILLLTLAAIIAACGDDNDTTTQQPTTQQPAVTLTEVGHADARHAHPGHDMHLEATIVLPSDLISSIAVGMTQTDGSYSFTQTFTDAKYVGKHNADFHEHIDIPADAPLGAYQLTLAVLGSAGTRAAAAATVQMEEGGEEEDDDHGDHDHGDDHGDHSGPDTSLPVITDQGVVANPVDCQVYISAATPSPSAMPSPTTTSWATTTSRYTTTSTTTPTAHRPPNARRSRTRHPSAPGSTTAPSPSPRAVATMWRGSRLSYLPPSTPATITS